MAISQRADHSVVILREGGGSTSFFVATKLVDGPPSRTMTSENLMAG
jgi:hypothetical protein